LCRCPRGWSSPFTRRHREHGGMRLSRFLSVQASTFYAWATASRHCLPYVLRFDGSAADSVRSLSPLAGRGSGWGVLREHSVCGESPPPPPPPPAPPSPHPGGGGRGAPRTPGAPEVRAPVD